MLVVDQGYSTREAAKAMNVSKSAIDNWVQQLKKERNNDITNQTCSFSAEQYKINELETRIKQIENDKETLKKTISILISDSLNN